MADTGASVNLLDEVSFAKLRLIQPEIGKANVKIFPYGSDKQLTLVGKCQCEVETDTKFSVETFIVEAKAGCLVSWKSSQRFSLVQVVRAVREPEANKVELLVQSYSDLFEGLGKLKGFQVHLHVDKEVQPIAQSHRRVPFHVRKHLEEQLTRDEELGVIEKRKAQRHGYRPVVVVPKKERRKDLSLCGYAPSQQVHQEREAYHPDNQRSNQ